MGKIGMSCVFYDVLILLGKQDIAGVKLLYYTALVLFGIISPAVAFQMQEPF